MSTTVCDKCNKAYRNCNITKHLERCNGIPSERFIKQHECKYCLLTFDTLTTSERANHSRWCVFNPKAAEYKNNKILKDRFTPDVKQTISSKVKKLHKDGLYDCAKQKQRLTPSFLGKTHSKESKAAIQKAALNSKHRRLQRNITEYVKKDGTVIILDSSWEVILATRLDELNILWNRPDPIPWVDSEGKQHNYFPDFYLPEYNVFLDPKNPQAALVQKQKIDILNDTYTNIIWLYSVDECKNFNVPVV